MRCLVSDRHATLPAHLLHLGVRHATVCTFDAHLDTADRPALLRRRLVAQRAPAQLIDTSFYAGCSARPLNSNNVWSACAALDVVDQVLWVCPDASTDAAARIRLVRVLFEQGCWDPEVLLCFLQSRASSLSLDGLRIRAVPRTRVMAVLSRQPIDVFDVDLDVFYDARRDGVRSRMVSAFEEAAACVQPQVVSVATSVSEGYCPRRLAECVVGNDRVVSPGVLQRRVRSLSGSRRRAGLAARTEWCRLRLRYRTARQSGRSCQCGTARRRRLPCALLRARDLVERGDYTAALSAYGALQARHRDDWRLRYALSLCALRIGRYDLLASLVAGDRGAAQVAPLLYMKSQWLAHVARDRGAYEAAQRASALAPCWAAPLRVMHGIATTRRWHHERRAIEARLTLVASLLALTLASRA